MGTLLVIANQTIANAELTAAVRERVDRGVRSAQLLVPAATISPAIAAGLAAVESAAISVAAIPDQQSLAEERLEAGLAWLRGLGLDADGRVAPGDAVPAVQAITGRFDIDEIIVSTLPSRLSRWLRQDLPNRIARAVDVPVVVVTAPGEPKG